MTGTRRRDDTSTAMSTNTNEKTPSERLERAVIVTGRGRRYLRGAIVVFAVGVALTAFITTKVRRTFLSECTFAVHAVERPGQEAPPDGFQKRSARIKDMAHERARLESAISKFNLYPDVAESSGILEAVEAMRPNVGLRARDSGRFVVSFTTTEAPGIDARNLARDVTQFLAESITDDYVGANLAELRTEATFLGKLAATASADIDGAVKGVSDFLTRHPEFAVDVPQTQGTGFKVAKKAPAPESHGDAILAALLRQKARLETDLRVSAMPGPPTENLPRAQAVAALDAATRAYAVAQADVLTKSAKLTPEHPDMKVAQSLAALAAKQLQDARVALAAIDGAVKSTPATQSAKLTEIDAQIAAREAALVAKGVVAPATASTQPKEPLDLETEWQRLLRELGEAKKRYDDLKSKSEALELALKATETRKASVVAILEPAYRPLSPAKGRRAIVAMLGLVSAAAFALLYMITRALLENRLIDGGDIEALELAPSLGELAHIEGPRGESPQSLTHRVSNALLVRRTIDEVPFSGWPVHVRVVQASPTAPEVLAVLGDDPKPVAALRLVRHRLELLHGEGMRLFAITSPRGREGKTTFAAQLALILSESQRARVVLVEASFRRPALARLLGFTVPEGEELSTQIVRTIRGSDQPWTALALGPSLHVFAESEDQPRRPRALHSACLSDLLQMLAGLYDYVLIDAPSVLDEGEANALEPVVDGMIIVARAFVSKKSELRRAIRQLGQRKAVGAVLIAAPTETAR